MRIWTSIGKAFYLCNMPLSLSGFANDLTIDVKNASATQKEKVSQDGSLTPDSLSNGDGKSGNFLSGGEHALKGESAYTHSEDELARSPQGGSARRNALDSPSSDVFAKSIDPDAETHRYYVHPFLCFGYLFLALLWIYGSKLWW